MSYSHLAKIVHESQVKHIVGTFITVITLIPRVLQYMTRIMLCLYTIIQVKCINVMSEYTQSCRNRSLYYRRTNLLPLHRARVETSKIDEFRVDVRFGTQSPYTRNAMRFVTILPLKKRKNSTTFVNLRPSGSVRIIQRLFKQCCASSRATSFSAPSTVKYPTCFKQNTNVLETYGLWDIKMSAV